MEEEKIRLQKYLAECGIASRRKAEEYIQEGKVQVNGKVVTELGVKINPEKDIVYFNNKKVAKQNENIYILLNKPIGYVTTTKEQFNRETVLDLIKGINKRIVPVGRLDMYTSGALILTNDGDFTYKVTHPSHEITKTYVATLRGIVTYEEMEKLKSGVEIEDYLTRPAKVKILKTDTEKNISRIEITIHEGKNRQVRKMCEAIGKKVIALHRSKIGNIGVKDLRIGEFRYLSKKEVDENTIETLKNLQTGKNEVFLDLKSSRISKTSSKILEDSGFNFEVWTVDSSDEIKELAEYDCKGITTNKITEDDIADYYNP